MNKLNGWMRLWVFLSLIWIFYVLVDEFETFTHSPHTYKVETHGTVTWDDEVDEPKPWKNYSKIIETKESTFAENLYRVIKIALIPPAIMFAFGYGIAWARRGFKNPN